MHFRTITITYYDLKNEYKMEISLFIGVNIMFIKVKFMGQLLNGFMLNFTGVPNVPSQFAL